MTLKNYGLITSMAELVDLTEPIHHNEAPFAIDIETGFVGPDREKGSVHPETAIVVGFSFSPSTEWARYVPLAHDEGENLNNRDAAAILWDLLQTGRAVAHNMGFELRHLAKFFRENLGNDPLRRDAIRASKGYFPIRSDTLVEAYLVAEYEKFGLKPLTKAMFDHNMTELYDLFPDLPVNRRKYLRFNVLPLEPKVVDYACEDSVWCLAIHQRYYPLVKDRLLYKVEKAIVEEVLWAMEDEGICYDWTLMRQVADELREFRDRYNAEIMADLSTALGKPVAINLGSPKQVGEVLFGSMGLRTSVYTKGTRDLPAAQRRMSTGDIALQKLSKSNPVVKKILQWRNCTKLLGSYLDKYEDKFNFADDGRVHANHLSAFVRTGRFATSEPNYQQCLPGSYQVLTPDGWVRLDRLPDGVSVAQYDDTQTISFIVPCDVVRNEYDGEMVELDAGRVGRWRYTPNHRIVWRSRTPRGDRHLSAIKEGIARDWMIQLNRRDSDEHGRKFHDRYIPCAGYTNVAGQLDTDALQSLALAVATQADGTRTKGNQYDICVYKDRKVEALRRLGLDPQQYEDGRWRVRIPIEAVSHWLDDTKNFRADNILKLNRIDLRVFLDEIMQWDGDFTRGMTYGQKNSRRQSVDVVQAAAALTGRATSLYERPDDDHVVLNLHPRAHRDSGYQVARTVQSDGWVYCVTVPSGMFLVRNDEGHVQVTGNSPKKYHLDLAEAVAAHEADLAAPDGSCFKFNFRDVIIAPPDHYILGFDLSQAELRAIAGEAQEWALLEAFANGDDVHSVTASLMLGIPLDQVTDEQRQIGKMLNFALLYGMSVKGLADRLAILIEEAQSLMDKYFAGLPAIAAYITKQQTFGKTYGFVESKFGRKLPIWEFKSPNPGVRAGGERACVNYPIQGAATGDYMKIAMVQAMRAIRKAGLADKIKLVMNVHDALEFYVHRSLAPQDVIALLQPAVVFEVSGWPAMKADWHIAKRWGSPTDLHVADDGAVTVKGSKTVDLVPTVEVDNDGEEIVILPEVDEQVLREAAKPAFNAGRHVVVTLAAMPQVPDWRSFIEFAKGLPGYNSMTVVTPEGDVEGSFRTGLTPEHLGKVAALLRDPAVTIAYLADNVAGLAAGLTL